MFLGKGVLKICSIFTGEHPCRSFILMKLLCNFLEIKLRHLCSPVNLLHIFSTSFLRTPMEGCFLKKFVAKTTKYLILRFCYGHETGSYHQSRGVLASPIMCILSNKTNISRIVYHCVV